LFTEEKSLVTRVPLHCSTEFPLGNFQPWIFSG